MKKDFVYLVYEGTGDDGISEYGYSESTEVVAVYATQFSATEHLYRWKDQQRCFLSKDEWEFAINKLDNDSLPFNNGIITMSFSFASKNGLEEHFCYIEKHELL